MDIHHSKYNRAAKAITPTLTRLLMRKPFAHGLRMFSVLLEAVQGKGSGSGWDVVGEAEVANRFLPAGEVTVFDIDANMGNWSRELRALRKSARTRIFQIEPAAFCRQHLEANKAADTTIIGAAVGAKPGMVDFNVPEPGSTVSSVFQVRETYAQADYRAATRHVEQVAMTTIDAIIEEHGLAQVDFLKMDVEGNEFPALEGAAKSLASGKIRAMSFEFGSPQINARIYFHDFWDLLNPLGYRFLRMCPAGVLHPVTEYYEDLEYFRGATNYLAVRPELVPRG